MKRIGKKLATVLLAVAMVVTFMPVMGAMTGGKVGTQTAYAAADTITRVDIVTDSPLPEKFWTGDPVERPTFTVTGVNSTNGTVTPTDIEFITDQWLGWCRAIEDGDWFKYQEDGVQDLFFTGGENRMMVDIWADCDAVFTGDTEVYLNGEQMYFYKLYDGDTDYVGYLSYNSQGIKVERIDVTASSSTPPEVGDVISQPTFNIVATTPSEDVKLQIDSYNTGWTTKGGGMYQDGEMVNGTKVGLQVRIMPQSDHQGEYDFSQTEVYVNGEELEVTDSSVYDLWARNLYDTNAVEANVYIHDLGGTTGNQVSLDGADFSSQKFTYVKKGSPLKVYAKPGENAYFVRWTKGYNGETLSTDPVATITLNEDSEIYAVFAKNTPAAGDLTDTTEYTFDEASGTVTISKKADAEYGYTGYSTLGGSPFLGSTKVKHVVFEEGITEIGSFTFENTDGIEDITIPASVSRIHYRAFEDCFLCGSGFSVDADNETYQSMSGSLFSKDGRTMYRFVQAAGMTEYTIPDGVKTIGSMCFEEPDLDKLTLRGDGLALMDYSIDGGSIDHIVIEEGLDDLGEYISFTCQDTDITIPSTVTAIGTQTTFRQSSNLKEISVAAGNTKYKSMDGVLYTIEENDGVQTLGLARYPAAKEGSTFTTPAGVTSVEFNALGGTDNLSEVTLSEDVSSVNYGAFRYAKDMTVTFLNPDCAIDSSAFAYNSGGITIKAITGSTAEAFANNNGIPFESMGSSLGKLDPPANPRWDGYTVSWDANPDATRYEVKFFAKDSEGIISDKGSFITTDTSFTYDPSKHDAFWWKTSDYWVTISAGKAGYESSDAVTSPVVHGKFTMNKPADPTIKNDVMSWPVYTDDGESVEIRYWIGVTDKNGNVVSGVHSTWLGTETSIDLRKLFEDNGIAYGDYTIYYDAWVNYYGWSLAISDTSNTVKWHYGKDISGATVTGISNKTYTGKAITQTPTVKLDGITLTSGTDYTVSYKNNTNAGTATMVITGINNFGSTIEKTFKIGPVIVSANAKTGLVYNGKSQTGVAAGAGYTVSGNTATNAGTYEATVSLKDKTNYTWSDGTTADKKVKWKLGAKPITPAVTLSVASYTWNGKNKKPAVTVKDGSTKLTASDYTVTYKNNKNVGKASAVVTLKGNYSGTKTVNFAINPKGTSLSKVTAAKKAATVNWKKQSAKMSSRITGYQIQVATNSKFTKNKMTVTVKGYSKTSKKITKLKGGKKYYVRIRTYKTVKGTKYYSPWSKVKTVTTKK